MFRSTFFFLFCLLQGNQLKVVQSVFAPVRKFSSPSFTCTCTRLHGSKSPLSKCNFISLCGNFKNVKNTEKMRIEPAISPCLWIVPSKCLSFKPPFRPLAYIIWNTILEMHKTGTRMYTAKIAPWAPPEPEICS